MKIKLFAFITLISLVLFSCATTEQEPEKKAPPAPVIEEPVADVPVEIVDETPQILEEDEVMDVPEEDDEYLRSINDIDETVTKEEFNEDKAAILQIIDELSDTMTNFNFEKWKKYISPDSIEYYSNPTNLRKVQKKLPDKTIQLKGLRDYFKYVFIPSRKQSQVDEIRYISKTNTKAVEVKDDGTLVVYYYFVKVKGKWMVQLPEA